MEDGKLQIIQEKLEHATKAIKRDSERKKRVSGEDRRVLGLLPMNT
jgi:hypothetical protein